MMVEECVETNFFALPVQKTQAFPLDVGSDLIIDVNRTNSFTRVHTRKVPSQTETQISLEGACVPLTLPQYSFIAPERLVTRRPPHLRSRAKQTRTRLALQYEWYVEKAAVSHQHQGLRRALGKRQWEAVSSNYNSYWDQFKGTQYLHQNKVVNATTRSTKTVQSPFYDLTADIPRKLLLRLLDESCLDDYDEAKERACLKSCVTKLSDDVVVYSCGPYDNEVVILKLVVSSRGRGLLCHQECGRVDVENRIMELLHVEEQECLVARTKFAVTILKVVSLFICSLASLGSSIN